MRSYAETVFSADAREALRIAEAVVRALPDGPAGEWLRCHEVARAVCSRLTDALLFDGVFGGFMPHTWLYVRNGSETRVLLDPYAIGRLPQVQLVDPSFRMCDAYVRGDLRKDIRRAELAALIASLPEVL